MAISNTSKTIGSRQNYAKLKGETIVEVENHQAQSLNGDRVDLVSEISAPETTGTLAITGVRPVSTGKLEVVETYNAMGIRPIGANHIQVVENINLSGIRPVSSSSLVVAQSYSVFGNRPVASNDIDDSTNLMGFLD